MGRSRIRFSDRFSPVHFLAQYKAPASTKVIWDIKGACVSYADVFGRFILQLGEISTPFIFVFYFE